MFCIVSDHFHRLCWQYGPTHYSGLFLVSRVSKSTLSLRNVWPTSSNVVTNAFTSFLHIFWVLGFCSWCLFDVWDFRVWKLFSNSSNSRYISGPATIYLSSACGSSVNPTAPPSPFINLFICQWHWSIVIAEKNIFCTKKNTIHKLRVNSRMCFNQVTHISNVNW